MHGEGSRDSPYGGLDCFVSGTGGSTSLFIDVETRLVNFARQGLVLQANRDQLDVLNAKMSFAKTAR